MYTADFGSDTLANLGTELWQLVSDKIKLLQRYQSSNLKLKLEPLATADVNCLKRLLKTLVLLKLVQISSRTGRVTFTV